MSAEAHPAPRTVLIGAHGQLAGDIARTWPAGQLTGLSHADLEVTDRSMTLDVIGALRPQLVIDTAAFHNVDACESEPERAFAVNAIGAMNVADACREAGAALMFISTDYVYAGTAGKPYRESDAVDPVNVYGASKAAGEMLVRARLAEHYIVRTSGLYGLGGSSGKGGNFVERMLQLASEGRDLRVVDDQRLSPTSTADLARALLDLVRSAGHGTYHITNSGDCSWYEFARAIFDLAGVEARLSPTSTEEFGAKARRPTYSVLEHAAMVGAGLTPLRSWREALAEFIATRAHKGLQPEITGGTR